MPESYTRDVVEQLVMGRWEQRYREGWQDALTAAQRAVEARLAHVVWHDIDSPTMLIAQVRGEALVALAALAEDTP